MDDSPFDPEGPVAGEPGAQGDTANENCGVQSEDPGGPGEGKSRKGRGGPRTPEGKARSSKNARRHGILSPDPTAGGESPDDYQDLLAGMREQFCPSNLYQEELVAQLSCEWIALHRITRQVTALINLRTQRIDPPPLVSFVKPAKQPTRWSAYKRPLEAEVALKHLDLYTDNAILGAEVVEDIIYAIPAAGLNLPEFDPGAPPAYSAGFVRHLVARTAAANGVEGAAVVKRVAAVLDEALELAMYATQRVAESRDELMKRENRSARSYVPDYEEYDKLLRYKRSIERSIERWVALLHEAKK